MNESRTLYNDVGATDTVYTDPSNDPLGISREIARGEDVLYPGTCEADIICYSAVLSTDAAEGSECGEGYVCDERTSSEISMDYLCRAGYVCAFGTTPDATLLAPMGQFRMLCPAGYVCTDGVGLRQAYRTLCPDNYYCPTGTGDVYIGTIASDAISRGLTAQEADPYNEIYHIRYAGDDDIRVISSHDRRCFEGVDEDLKLRYITEWIPAGDMDRLENIFLSFFEYLRTTKTPIP